MEPCGVAKDVGFDPSAPVAGRSVAPLTKWHSTIEMIAFSDVMPSAIEKDRRISDIQLMRRIRY